MVLFDSVGLSRRFMADGFYRSFKLSPRREIVNSCEYRPLALESPVVLAFSGRGHRRSQRRDAGKALFQVAAVFNLGVGASLLLGYDKLRVVLMMIFQLEAPRLKTLEDSSPRSRRPHFYGAVCAGTT